MVCTVLPNRNLMVLVRPLVYALLLKKTCFFFSYQTSGCFLKYIYGGKKQKTCFFTLSPVHWMLTNALLVQQPICYAVVLVNFVWMTVDWLFCLGNSLFIVNRLHCWNTILSLMTFHNIDLSSDCLEQCDNN